MNLVRRCAFWRVGAAALLAGALGATAAAGEDAIDFRRQIRPILSNNCFKCHGPDEGQRQAGLRLDRHDAAVASLESGSTAVVAGDAAASALVARITAADPAERMPPLDSGKELSADEIELLTRWIEQGAPWGEHWAFVPPERPAVPAATEAGWVRNPIDAFVLARLERESLRPAPAADPVTLLRRLHLDLTGLPPTIDEIEALLAAIDAGTPVPEAIDAQVERLLGSPHYGERWGRIWLDGARYADSDGYEKDKARFVWFYRDWVVGAINRDLPYDQFVIQQIAGDLLPGAGQDERVATGFLRNSMINEEGGVDPEQFRMEAMFDRMDALGKSVLGLTVQCCQCHDHKFDPFTQRDYYRMFAFINDTHEASIACYTAEQQAQRSAIFAEIAAVEAELQAATPDWREQLAAWEQAVQADLPAWSIVRPQLDASGGQKHYVLEDGSILAAGYAPTKHTTEFTVDVAQPRITALRLELLNDPNLPLGGPGRSIDGLCALTEFKATAAPLDHPDQTQELKFSAATADANPAERELAATYDDRSGKRRVTGPVAYANDGVDETAWGIDVGAGRSNMPRNAVFAVETPLENAAGWRVTFRLVQNHGGWNSDDNQNNNLGRFRLSVTDAAQAAADQVPAVVLEIMALPAEQRTPEQAAVVFSCWRTTVPHWQAANDRIEALWQQHPRGASQLVLAARQSPRQTHLLARGDFLKPTDPVAPGVPDFLNAMHAGQETSVEGQEPAESAAAAGDGSNPCSDAGSEISTLDTPLSRLDFARWLVARDSPTAARAIVNRVWQAYFGTGLVATSEDLGSQCEAPSHPELLDWLAVEFMDRGWSLKELHRLIAGSATYRQSSHVAPELYARDPANRLLARGPRHRIDAELVRDVALAASGLLNPKLGGPSVHPPAPEFLFLPPASYGPKVWHEDLGEDRYRRALYTFRFRSVPYPALQAFDAPNGDASCVRRSRSNTPLQALTTLNEPLSLECARELALRTLRDGGTDDAQRLEFAFRRCVARRPTERETGVLLGLLARQSERFASEGAQPWVLAASDPANPPALTEGTTPAQLAAWTAVARVLLNLDETISKE
jgi:hypothetical protein